MTQACPACVAAPDLDDVQLVQTPSVQLSVPRMHCAACIATIERHLRGLDDVFDAKANLSLKRVQIVTDRSPTQMVDALGDVGFEAYPLDERVLSQETDPVGRDLLMRLGIAGFAMMNVMLLSVAVWSGASGATRDLFHLISALIALPAALYSAQPFFANAMRALRVRRLNMDVPISLAILLAGGMSLYETLLGGEHAYFDAALSLTFFLLIGRYLEHNTRSAARSAAKELAAMEAYTADRRGDNGVETVPIDALGVGDIVVVPTGVRVPVDGYLISTTAFTDRAHLTGESDPISHTKGALINAGEVNMGAPFDVEAKAVGADTRLHDLARLVETAEFARNRYTSLADRAAAIYAPAVHALALLTFIGWVIFDGDIRHALNVAIAVLIITCPCALGLAVPAVSTAAISALYRLGFLVKSGTALERLADVQTIVLDKTGTLTTPGFNFDLSAVDESDLRIAKALAQESCHPLSKALATYLAEVAPADLTDISELSGQGVSAKYQGRSVALGRAHWLGHKGDGLWLKNADRLTPLPFTETLTPGAGDMVAGLSQQGYTLGVLSGDTQEKTAALAGTMGIETFVASTSPEEKNDYIQELEAQGTHACMIGDGLNDAVALASAHASVAPGSALDAARSAADVVAIRQNWDRLPLLFQVARKAVHLSRQNFGIALAYNAIAIPIAVLGFATPLMAALAMSFSSITVLLNAMRVVRVSP